MRRHFSLVFFAAALLLWSPTVSAKKKKVENDTIKSSTLSGLTFRSIGPAFASGRIADFAVNPDDINEFYIGVASGGIWKTVNGGTTFSSVFDNYGSYSIGCLAMDPNNHNIVWAGTGENNHQRALGYGDGVYKTLDGGKSWKNMGLKDSRQIGKIVIDPRNSDVVYVAAEGSVWGPGGERGLYKTTDGGENWDKVLEISENTGVNNIVFDPRNPDVLYATSEQRRRHVFTKIGGGPESHVYKSTDAGKSWRKIEKGLTGADKGGMGIAVSPVNPDVLYLIVEAAEDKGGFYRSTDCGESWNKMSDHNASGQYYNEIYCDPIDVDVVYSVETISHKTLDGGKTWISLGNNKRHVDDHAFWVNPDNTKHFLIGTDGGTYISHDGGKNYRHIDNMPITQFYRVAVDNDYPFYSVYGGTQDNNSFGGPNRNTTNSGVTKGEWVVTVGGDGFWQAVDPENSDIVYSEYQYGNSYRYDKKSGESISIKAQPREGEESYRWNWNAPFIISPNNHKRLYSAANKLFRSDDRGNTWTVISDDLTRSMDRNTWKVMGRYWSNEAVRKDVSTSLYGTIVSIDESRVKENLLYVGTDDGLVQVSEDAKTWRKADDFPGVPEYTYVSDIQASKFDENVVFVSFDNRKRDDFKPYLLKSNDKGKTWVSIVGNLPENGTVHSIQQDYKNKNILFAGTEFGVFVSVNGGKYWAQLKSGIPTIAVRDIAIQEREDDLVLATFGRGFYILDNYSVLREIDKDFLKKKAHMFDIKDALMYIETGYKYGQGSTEFFGENPKYGATFSYYVKDVPLTLKQERKKREKKLIKEKAAIPMPSDEELRLEEKEHAPYFVFTITDEANDIVRKFTKKATKGINRVNWDLRYGNFNPISLRDDNYNPMNDGGSSILVMPGKYFVKMDMIANGVLTPLTEPKEFTCKLLNNRTLPAENHEEMVAFQLKISKMVQSVRSANRWASDLKEKMQYIRQAFDRTPGATYENIVKASEVDKKLDDILFKFTGKTPKASREENPPAQVSINERLNSMAWAHWSSMSGITTTEKSIYNILKKEYPKALQELKDLYENDIMELQKELDKLNAPYTPGRIPVWEE